MLLQDKILYCRKKAGLSQEQLAERIGVSRQAVSKWETGDAVPEIGKLSTLAKTFSVTVDWLLSESEPETEKAAQPPVAPLAVPAANAAWVDAIPGAVGKLLRQHGWLFGVYTALTGLGFTVIGGLARILTRSMLSMDDGMFLDGTLFPADSQAFSSGTQWFDEFGNRVAGPLGETVSSFAANNPVTVMGTAIMVIGLVLIVAGVLLAVILKKRSRQ